ncbi:kinase-like protein [Trametopsis cervina]|nr:kinase-like protein [Trametopsis cervina]
MLASALSDSPRKAKPMSPGSPSSKSSPHKLIFSKPDALRAPLKIKIPLPQLQSSPVQFQHHRRSLARGSANDADTEEGYSPVSLSSSDSEEPTTSRREISVLSPNPHPSGTFPSPNSLSYASSSASSSSSSEESTLASASTLVSTLAADDLEVFGTSGAGEGLTNEHGPYHKVVSALSSPSQISPSPSEKVLRSVQNNTSPTSRFSRPRNHHRGLTHPRSPRYHAGPFQFLESLNKGSYGSAYAAKDLSTGRVLCVKVCTKGRARARSLSQRRDSSCSESESSSNESFRRDCEFVKGMRAEMHAYQRIAGASEHDKKWLMELHGVLQDPERVVFVMDLMETDLFSILSSPILPSTCRRWLAQIAIGIDALHNLGVIHRDIKPENILVVPGSSRAHVRITDFTNAWVSHDATEPLKWWRKYSKKYIGTKEYLAPEIHRTEWYGIMVDWWALGCLVYDVLVGDALFPDERTLNFYIKWQRDGKTAESYLTYRANFLNDDEVDLMAGLLALDPSKRFRLEHLEQHPLFLESTSEGIVNVFEELRDVSVSSIRKRMNRAWASRDKDNTVDDSLKDEPLCYATAAQVPQYVLSDAGRNVEEEEEPFEDLRWINPNGILAGV